MKHFDVTIVGAGLAGLHCARLLGQRGLSVLLIDRKTTLDHKVHTTGIFVRKTLEDFQLPEDCLGPVISDVSLYSPARRVMHLSSRRDEFRIGRMGPLYLRYLQDCERARVTWKPNTSYLCCDDGRELIKVVLSKGSVCTRFLIGADGATSRVANDLQLDQNTEWIVGVENVFKDVSIDSEPRLFCFLDPQLAPGYIAWIAWDGEEAHVGVGGYPAQFDPVSALEKFQASVSSIVDLESATLLERRGGRIPVGGVLRRIANKRGLLVGDAAGAVSPLTAGGLDPCIRLSNLAGQVVSEFLETGDEKILERYSGEYFRTRFASRLWARRILATTQSELCIELACGVLRLPIFNRFASHLFFSRGSFPDIARSQFKQRSLTQFFRSKGSAAPEIVRPTQT
jgi:flavin-dependent dehydrogenase